MSANEQAAMQVISETMFDKGWSRTLPPSLIALLAEIPFEGPRTRVELDARLRLSPHSPEGMASSVWEPLHDWTDEELRKLDAEFGEPDEPRLAVEVMAEEAAQREADIATLERYLASKELPIAHTLGALLDLLIACDVVRVDDHGGHWINPLAPLPGEVLPLSADEAARQDKLRWEHLHEATAQEIIRLFRPDGHEIDHLVTDLGHLAARLDRDPEDVRSALQTLIDSGDFSATVDLETVTVGEPFVLRVDWEAFHASRIVIRFESPDDH